MNHPDAPDREDARLYFVYDTTERESESENVQEDRLQGDVQGLRAQDAFQIRAKMISAKLAGPQALLKAPSTNVHMIGNVLCGGSGGGGGAAKPGKDGKQGRHGKDGKHGKHGKDGKAAGKPTGPVTVQGFKLIPRITTESKRLLELLEDLKKHPQDTVAFEDLLKGKNDELDTLYTALRTLLAGHPPEEVKDVHVLA